ncbi:MAG: lipoate--protein ligase family protein [Gammaproteobacteria bacterium]|nr:lipoate--protein ligase family protein [Gammaproteobacteria bacterium]
MVDSDLSEPAFTVAADEAIAKARSEGKVPNTLHFYRRNVPTISLGYFQEVEKSVNLKFCQQNNIQIVRRITGGSAVYTDSGHLLYGLAVDEAILPTGRNEAFETVCESIVLALKELGIEAEFKPVNDIMVNGRKISGSAQMRRWGIVLQHGTLVLSNEGNMLSNALKMDIPKIEERGQQPETYVTSISEITGQESDIKEIKSAIVKGFEAVFDIEFEASGLTDYENELIKQLINEKYGNNEWNMKR